MVFGKQIYLNDNQQFELTLATIDQMGTYFFLLIECQKGRICYASSSIESILGYKRTELCLQSLFDITYPDDIEIIKQQFINEKNTSVNNNEDSSNDINCTHLLTTRQNCLEIGNRRAFSCRIKSKTKRSHKTTNTLDNYLIVAFVGYIKQYSLIIDNQNEIKPRNDRRHSTLNTLTPTDVINVIGTNPVSCVLDRKMNLKQLNKNIRYTKHEKQATQDVIDRTRDATELKKLQAMLNLFEVLLQDLLERKENKNYEDEDNEDGH
jgi:PAS domain-containing protein